MIKYSRQREAIRTFLESRVDHPTAEFVYSNIRKEYPNISLGTVYRNLNFLCEQGDAIRISCGDGFDHFDGNPKPHNHFACRKCGAVIDLDMDDISFINTLAAKNFNGQIDGHSAFFYGTCEKCINT